MNRARPSPARTIKFLIPVVLFATIAATADETSEESDGTAAINNLRVYSENFASSGQPTEAQLHGLQAEGFERIVYIAWTDNERSLPHEDRVVKSLGMQYVHIPVDWQNPSAADFYLFASAMQSAPARKTLLHCQVNFRASAFSFLYRVIYENVPVVEAKRDLNSVWQPNETWRDLIFEVLAGHRISPHCDGCDWTPPPAETS